MFHPAAIAVIEDLTRERDQARRTLAAVQTDANVALEQRREVQADLVDAVTLATKYEADFKYEANRCEIIRKERDALAELVEQMREAVRQAASVSADSCDKTMKAEAALHQHMTEHTAELLNALDSQAPAGTTWSWQMALNEATLAARDARKRYPMLEELREALGSCKTWPGSIKEVKQMRERVASLEAVVANQHAEIAKITEQRANNWNGLLDAHSRANIAKDVLALILDGKFDEACAMIAGGQ